MAILKPVQPKKWIGYYECIVAFCFCLLATCPLVFKYEITCTDMNVTNIDENDDFTTNGTMSCCIAHLSQIAQKPIYQAYKITSQTILRILPITLITLLNIFMYKKIKTLFRNRKIMFKNKKNHLEVPKSRTDNQELSALPSNRLSISQEVSGTFRRPSHTGSILRKIIKKWYVFKLINLTKKNTFSAN